jgi:hypothetical protein
MDRTIEDRVAGEVLTLAGTLALVADGDDAVAWQEAGTLSRPGHRAVSVTRTLRVVRRPGDGWWVVFDHGGDFHPWTPGTPVDHPCGADHYRGLVDVEQLPAAWRVTWEVTGPAKDYTMVSTLTRG